MRAQIPRVRVSADKMKADIQREILCSQFLSTCLTSTVYVDMMIGMYFQKNPTVIITCSYRISALIKVCIIYVKENENLIGLVFSA